MKLAIVGFLLMLFGYFVVSGAIPLTSTVPWFSAVVKVIDVEGKAVAGASVGFYVNGVLDRSGVTVDSGTFGTVFFSYTGQPIIYTVSVDVSDRGYHRSAGPFSPSFETAVTHVFDDVAIYHVTEPEPDGGDGGNGDGNGDGDGGDGDGDGTATEYFSVEIYRDTRLTVSKSPDYDQYAKGSTVQLTAQSSADATFDYWIVCNRDIADVGTIVADNPLFLVMDSNKSVTAYAETVVHDGDGDGDGDGGDDQTVPYRVPWLGMGIMVLGAFMVFLDVRQRRNR